jgi:MoaA/NifB/PqqE/SkfB family radical SAM enzyme
MDNLTQLERLALVVTDRCNLRCKLCNSRLNSYFINDMKYPIIKKVLETAKELKVRELEILGGEPMLRKDICDIIEYATSLGINTTMYTNGTLIDEEKAQQLVNSGLKKVVISIDGYQEENDFLRGEGTYEKAVTAIRSFKQFENKLDIVTVKINISKYNSTKINDFANYLTEELGISSVRYKAMIYDGTNDEQFYLKEEEIDKLGLQIDTMNQQVKTGIGIKIDTSGSVYNYSDEKKAIGNIYTNSLEDILSA